MRTRPFTRCLALAGLVGAGGLAALSAPGASAATTCVAPPEMTFAEPGYVDTTRAGGEPIVFTHPDGTLLYGSHAGSTHFFAPDAADPATLAFPQEYRGQTYYWYSEDHGATWSFVDRTVPPSNVPGTGFSDPEFAFDLAGNVYISEINLANIAVSKSSDVGRSYQLQNATAQILSDRQWTEADEENVLYMVGNVVRGGTFPDSDPNNTTGASGHTLFKSKDGGATFPFQMDEEGGEGDLRVDKRNGTVYETLRRGGSELVVRAYRNARQDDFETVEENLVIDGVNMIAHWPSFDIDADGNLYITWDETGRGDREAGIYYSYSKDEGRTWATPVRLDADEKTDIWPWLAVGDTGRVGVAWFSASEELLDHNAQTDGTHEWRVSAAQSLNGLGCHASSTPAFTRSMAVDVPIHTGTICQAGTTCQAAAIDRRLGDYFSVEISGDGHFVVAYSDTREGGSVSLPGFTRQIGGATYFGPAVLGAPAATPVVRRPTGPAPAPSPRAPLPATGGSLAGSGLALLLAAAAAYRLRARRRPA